MTKIENRFSELWQTEHEGKQVPIAKKNENRQLAYEWYCKGIEYAFNRVDEMLEEQRK